MNRISTIEQERAVMKSANDIDKHVLSHIPLRMQPTPILSSQALNAFWPDCPVQGDFDEVAKQFDNYLKSKEKI